MATTVIHMRAVRHDMHCIYVGRTARGPHYGNPFTHKALSSTLAAVKVKTRDEAIARFRSWLDGTTDQTVQPERRQWVLANLPMLRGRVLACYCKPLACHGDVLAELADMATT